MKTEKLSRRYELIAVGVIGILLAYYMPQIASKLSGFNNLSVSTGIWTDTTNIVMGVSRLACVVYSISCIVVGMKKRT